MKVSELMKAMSDAGAPMDAILIAVRALEERDEIINAKRAVERDRKRRQRAKDRDTDGTVTGQSRDTDGTVTDQPSLSRPPLSSPQTPQQTPPTHTHPETPPRARASTPTRKAPAGDEFPRPEWADADVWRDFLSNRKRKRLPNTATAYRGFLSDIAKLATDEWPPGRLLEHAAMKGWGAIYEPDEMKEQTSGRQFGTGGNVRAAGGGRNFAGSPGVVDIAQQVLADRRARSLAAGSG